MISRHILTTIAVAALCSFASVAFAQQPDAPGNAAPGIEAPGAAAPEVDLPVTRAVLFASGVGYFEHAGTVDGDGRLSLRFKTDQINDVLKSMVFMDAGEGTVSSITYASNDPIERALRSFGIDLSGDPTLPQLLSQLRGARVVVRAPEPIEGSILNVHEKQVVAGDPPVTMTEYHLVLVTARGIVSVPLESIESLELVDPKLREELDKALELLVQSRDTDTKPVVLHFTGAGERRVRVGYLVEMPVWKTSYRLDLSPLAEADGDEKPLLQGWAIVENTSDQDWNDVQLSLVAGRPISFIMDLYTPMYLDRPVVQPKLMASLRPRIYEEGLAHADERLGRWRELQRQARDVAGKAMEAESAPAAREMDAADGVALGANMPGFDPTRLGDGVQAAASAGSVGELFQFTLHHPVDMPRRRSAMIPIINQEVDAEKVSIYNQQTHATHPLNGVVLHNDTGLKMLAGPVTVFDGGSYAGDAQIDHLAPGDERLLSYAVDLAVTVDPSVNTTSQIVSASIVRGVLQVSRNNVWVQEYKIKNKAEQERTMIIEHPFVTGRKLIEPKEYDEKTPQWYRFRVPIEADKTGTFTVREEQVVTQGIAILNVDVGTLLAYQRNGEIPKDVREALARAIAIKQDLARLEQQFNEKQQQLNQIKQGQDRLRENIKTVGADSQLGKRYLAKLSSEEDQIEQLEREIADLRRQIEAKQNELANYVRDLNVR